MSENLLDKKKLIVSFGELPVSQSIDFLDFTLSNIASINDKVYGFHFDNKISRLNESSIIQIKNAFCEKCSQIGFEYEWSSIEDFSNFMDDGVVILSSHSQADSLKKLLQLNNKSKWIIVSEYKILPDELVFVYDGNEISEKAIYSFIELFFPKVNVNQTKLFIYYPDLQSTRSNVAKEIEIVNKIREKYINTEIHKVIGSSLEIMLYSSNFKKSSLFVMGATLNQANLDQIFEGPIEKILFAESIQLIILLEE